MCSDLLWCRLIEKGADPVRAPEDLGADRNGRDLVAWSLGSQGQGGLTLSLSTSCRSMGRRVAVSSLFGGVLETTRRWAGRTGLLWEGLWISSWLPPITCTITRETVADGSSRPRSTTCRTLGRGLL